MSTQALSYCGSDQQNHLDSADYQGLAPIQDVLLYNSTLHEILFPFRDQLELFENQKHLVLPKQNGGLIVSRIRNLFQISMSTASGITGARHFWTLQDRILRKIDAQYLRLEKQIKLKSSPNSVVGYESDQYTFWLLLDNKYVHLNDKFIAELPFELKYGAKQMVYHESVVLICEAGNLCHLFEIDEFYNVINVQHFSLFDKAGGVSRTGEDVLIFDAVIIDDVCFILSSKGLTSHEVYPPEATELFSRASARSRQTNLGIPDCNAQTCGKICGNRAVLYSLDSSTISILGLLEFEILQQISIPNHLQFESLNFLMSQSPEDFIILASGHSDKDLNLLFTLSICLNDSFSITHSPVTTKFGDIKRFTSIDDIITFPTIGYAAIISKHEFYTIKF